MSGLEVLAEITWVSSGRTRPGFMVRCGCGRVFRLGKYKLGKTKSCGCLVREAMRVKQTKHGHYREELHQVWRNMMQRCYSAKAPSYKHYGARGIQVCDRWRASYESFVLDVGPKPEGLSLDRVDANGHYEPGNVRWATRAVQARNTRNHKTSRTGIRGVTWCTRREKWRVAIYVEGKQKHLGYFLDIKTAEEVRRRAEQVLWGV